MTTQTLTPVDLWHWCSGCRLLVLADSPGHPCDERNVRPLHAGEIDPDAILDRVYDLAETICRRDCCTQYSKPCDGHITLLNGVEAGIAMTLRDLLGTDDGEEVDHG